MSPVTKSPAVDLHFAAISGVSSGNVMKASFSFWVRILGFTAAEPADVFIFGTNLKIVFQSNKIKLKKSSTTLATSQNISALMGKYIYIALAYVEDTGATNFPAMLSFSVNHVIASVSGTITGINVNETKIPKSVIGIYAKLWVYNNYINGIHGFVVNSGNSGLSPTPTIKKLIDGSTSLTGCVTDGDLNSQTGTGIGVSCGAADDKQFDTSSWCDSKKRYTVSGNTGTCTGK
ncbi:MAG: hypothetical protein GY861_10470 [bacterium]|nr:hypothetical protein [bacterium]